MDRYYLEFAVRHHNRPPRDEDRVMRSNVTAESELAARRMVLENAYAYGLLISRFVSVRRGSIKGDVQ